MQRLGAYIIVAMAIVTFGCSDNARRYVMPKDPDSMLAVVETDGVRLKRVDGAKLEDAYKVKLVPGSHSVEFIFTQKFPGYSTQSSAELTYTFSAGQKLLLKKNFVFINDPGLKLINEANGAEIRTSSGDSIFTMH